LDRAIGYVADVAGVGAEAGAGNTPTPEISEVATLQDVIKVQVVMA
jgi:hypothetical protein